MTTGEPLTKAYVTEVFKLMDEGKWPEFLSHIHESVDWTIKGTHPLAGRYDSRKAFQEKALAKISAGLKGAIKLRVAKIFVDAPWAIVELYAEDAVAKAGWPFDNTYCWVMRFDQCKIVEARAYLDSAMVARLINESEANGA